MSTPVSGSRSTTPGGCGIMEHYFDFIAAVGSLLKLVLRFKGDVHLLFSRMVVPGRRFNGPCVRNDHLLALIGVISA